ncbi:MAG: ABC transporter ATP-binding protein [Oscillospiraceae bacterium]|nr:ABC transporter ATP-binding protein [Oscillospiraceae bacterium]
MLKLKHYILPHAWYILLTFGIKFLGTIVELLIPVLMQTIVDDKVPAGNLGQIYLYGGAMLLCAVIALVANILANRMSAVSSGRITRVLRHDLFQKLEQLSARQMDRLTTSSAVSRLTSDTYNVNLLLTRVQRMGVRAPILLVGGILMMLSMDWVLSLVLIALLPFISLLVYKVTKTTVPMYLHVQQIQDDIVRVCQENITGIRVIKALSKTEYEKARFNKTNEQHSATALKAATINNITSPVTNLILNLGLTLVVLVGAYRVNSGHIEGGVILAFLQYFTMMLNATLGLTRIFIMWSKGEASAQRIAQVMAEPEDLLVLPQEYKEQNAPHIEFRDVCFSYTGIGTNLDHLSFRLERGQTLGILGSTGSGKSTLINLLMRLYDPDSGQILIDGQDLRTIPAEQLRKKFGVVFQNDFITEGTVAHNLRFFRQLDDAALERSARDAQADFIWEKEGALEAEVVVRGNNLSGGQKQRLLIARALAADPGILVLDDASSALDYATDAALRRALRQNYRHTTTVVVAQRVSSLRHADLILVLDDSRVIGAGNHAHLMQTCEEYRIIAQTQMGDGQEVV